MKRTSSLENITLLSFLRELINQVNVIKTKDEKNFQNKVDITRKKPYHPVNNSEVLSNSTIVNRWAYLSGFKPNSTIEQKLNYGVQRTMLNS